MKGAPCKAKGKSLRSPNNGDLAYRPIDDALNGYAKTKGQRVVSVMEPRRNDDDKVPPLRGPALWNLAQEKSRPAPVGMTRRAITECQRVRNITLRWHT